MEVTSKYISSQRYKIFAKHVDDLVQYFYLLTNWYEYYICLDDNEIDVIEQINNNLIENKMNPEFHRSHLFIVGNKNIHANICAINNLEFIDSTNDIMKDIKFNNSPILDTLGTKPSWIWENHVIGDNIYSSDKFRIFIMENLEHNWNILPYYKKNDYIFIIIGCFMGKWNFEYCAKTLNTRNPEYNRKNIIFMAAEPMQIFFAIEYGFSAILCNHNAIFCDEEKFSISEKEKIYDHVINCRPEKNFKQPHLTKGLNKLAAIKGQNFNKKDYYDMKDLGAEFLNDERLDHNGVSNVLNKSKTAGIYSMKEGACFSSGEYLLCGLPVISTDALGGRQIWYTKYNSIICDSSEISVKRSVEQALEHLKSGYFNPENIRAKHIEFARYQRYNLLNKIEEIFDKHGETYNFNTDDYVINNRFNTVRKRYSTGEYIQTYF